MVKTKALFRLIRNMLWSSGDKILPVHTCKRKLANDFNAFFTNKILNIRSELGLTDTHTGGSVTNCFSGVPLNTFRDAIEAEIWNITKLSPVKSCELDPLHTWLLKECKAELVPIITDIVNMSLRESMIPKSLKTALVRPLLKKTGLDSDILNIRIRKYIPQDISIILIKSLVMSRLDYSNGLLYGLAKCTVSGLQAVQNSAARIVTQERLRDHDSMSRALMELHWLPVDKRIEYKLLLYTYKELHGLAPGYLCELVVSYEPRRVLRSAESNLLTVPPGKPGKYGSRSFVRSSANLCNSLRGERAAWL